MSDIGLIRMFPLFAEYNQAIFYTGPKFGGTDTKITAPKSITENTTQYQSAKIGSDVAVKFYSDAALTQLIKEIDGPKEPIHLNVDTTNFTVNLINPNPTKPPPVGDNQAILFTKPNYTGGWGVFTAPKTVNNSTVEYKSLKVGSNAAVQFYASPSLTKVIQTYIQDQPNLPFNYNSKNSVIVPPFKVVDKSSLPPGTTGSTGSTGSTGGISTRTWIIIAVVAIVIILILIGLGIFIYYRHKHKK